MFLGLQSFWYPSVYYPFDLLSLWPHKVVLRLKYQGKVPKHFAKDVFIFFSEMIFCWQLESILYTAQLNSLNIYLTPHFISEYPRCARWNKQCKYHYDPFIFIRYLKLKFCKNTSYSSVRLPLTVHEHICGGLGPQIIYYLVS